LAIVRTDSKECYFHKRRKGGGLFTMKANDYGANASDILLPHKTFPEWVTEKSSWGSDEIKNPTLKTSVPIVPARFLPNGRLERYYILWEVEDWEEVPKDPILLKRITKNLFVALAFWNLTPLERALIRGR
jgi:hypothetical protein